MPILKKGNAKKYSNYQTIALISHASKIILKILRVGLQAYEKSEILGVQLEFGKAKESEIKLLVCNGS